MSLIFTSTFVLHIYVLYLYKYIYSTVQLQFHITTRYHAYQCVQHAKSSRVPRRDSAWHTSTATSNIAMSGHAWQLIVQGYDM